MIGVSVIIPCHNGAQRLPATLAHLARQIVPSDLPWEVLVVDNASTDGTASIALASWPKNPPAPLRIVHELQLGASPARSRGLNEAMHKFITVVDDDNWVCTNWVAVVAEVMSQHPQVGACGALSEAVCEGPIPLWFNEFKTAYAIGAWGEVPGDVTYRLARCWSAGLTIRKNAWEQLQLNGFSPLLAGRKHKDLTCGDDTEICCALRLAGWRWWYEPRLRFQHYLPASRLKWSYLRRLHRAFGASRIVLDIYNEIFMERFTGRSGRWIKKYWLPKFTYDTCRLASYGFKLLWVWFSLCEGASYSLMIESLYGRWRSLLRLRRSYEATRNKIASLPRIIK